MTFARPLVRLVAPVFVLLMAGAVVANAKPLFKRIFVRTYPEARDTKLDACETCHQGEEVLNPYGLALQKAGMRHADIEALDSDGDGTSNGDEIKALTNPGDPKSRPGVANGAKADSTKQATPDSAKAAKADSAKAGGARADSTDSRGPNKPGNGTRTPGVSARPDSAVVDTSYTPAQPDTI